MKKYSLGNLSRQMQNLIISIEANLNSQDYSVKRKTQRVFLYINDLKDMAGWLKAGAEVAFVIDERTVCAPYRFDYLIID